MSEKKVVENYEPPCNAYSGLLGIFVACNKERTSCLIPSLSKQPTSGGLTLKSTYKVCSKGVHANQLRLNEVPQVLEARTIVYLGLIYQQPSQNDSLKD